MVYGVQGEKQMAVVGREAAATCFSTILSPGILSIRRDGAGSCAAIHTTPLQPTRLPLLGSLQLHVLASWWLLGSHLSSPQPQLNQTHSPAPSFTCLPTEMEVEVQVM
jgi:hypothetical protein